VAKDDSALWKNGVKIATEYIDLAIQYQIHPIRVSKHITWIFDHQGFKLLASGLRQQVFNLKYKFGKGNLEEYFDTKNVNDEIIEDEIVLVEDQTHNNDHDTIVSVLAQLRDDLWNTVVENHNPI
jgi:hypothetical protein